MSKNGPFAVLISPNFDAFKHGYLGPYKENRWIIHLQQKKTFFLDEGYGALYNYLFKYHQEV